MMVFMRSSPCLAHGLLLDRCKYGISHTSQMA
jgi:hypothetical protein